MTWETVLQYLPDGLCLLVCLVGCLVSCVKQGSMKKMLQSLCPSVAPVAELEEKVRSLELQLAEIQSAIYAVLGDAVEKGGETIGDH